MLHEIVNHIAQWIISVERVAGFWGVGFLMAIESACIPLPSEVIMPFAGYMVSLGTMSLWEVTIAGAAGCVVGSIVAYYAGMLGGRPFAEKYGRFILLNPHDLEIADGLFKKYGEIITFVSRLLPIVRTFIAFPAGMARMNIWRFCLYTFVGSLPWCYFLAWLGKKLGDNWPSLESRFHQIHLVIGVLFVLGAAFWIRHHLMYKKNFTSEKIAEH